jgi:hypothetical protein
LTEKGRIKKTGRIEEVAKKKWPKRIEEVAKKNRRSA